MRMRSRAATSFFYVVLLLALVLAVPAFAQNPGDSNQATTTAPSMAPLNPAFVDYWNNVAQQGEMHSAVPATERPPGRIPSPVDWSHLAQQAAAPLVQTPPRSPSE